MSNETDLLKACVKAVQGEFEKVAQEFEDVMRNEIKGNRTGTLKSCMYHEKMSDTEYFVGIDQALLKQKAGFDYSNAYWKGRKEVRPKRKKALHWVEDEKDVFAKKAKATKGDDFVGRAVEEFSD
mgnify:CR=1 FL=1